MPKSDINRSRLQDNTLRKELLQCTCIWNIFWNLESCQYFCPIFVVSLYLNLYFVNVAADQVSMGDTTNPGSKCILVAGKCRQCECVLRNYIVQGINIYRANNKCLLFIWCIVAINCFEIIPLKVACLHTCTPLEAHVAYIQIRESLAR